MPYNTIAPQLALVPDHLGEIAVAQYSGATIPAWSAVVLDASNQLRGTTPAAGASAGGTFENMAISVALATVGSPAVGSLGILREALPSGGQRVACITRSICCPVRAKGAITCRALLSLATGSTGALGALQVAVAGEEIVGQALVDANDSEIFIARIFGSVSVHA